MSSSKVSKVSKSSKNCIFCKIVKGEIPCSKIYEDEHTLAFLDIMPINKGHTLVIPKKHYKNIFDIPEEELCEVMKAVKKIAPAIQDAANADGVNITSNNEEAAGQVVMHSHTHIIPRFKDDGLKHWSSGEYGEKEADEYQKKIEAFLNK